MLHDAPVDYPMMINSNASQTPDLWFSKLNRALNLVPW